MHGTNQNVMISYDVYWHCRERLIAAFSRGGHSSDTAMCPPWYNCFTCCMMSKLQPFFVGLNQGVTLHRVFSILTALLLCRELYQSSEVYVLLCIPAVCNCTTGQMCSLSGTGCAFMLQAAETNLGNKRFSMPLNCMLGCHWQWNMLQNKETAFILKYNKYCSCLRLVVLVTRHLSLLCIRTLKFIFFTVSPL